MTKIVLKSPLNSNQQPLQNVYTINFLTFLLSLLLNSFLCAVYKIHVEELNVVRLRSSPFYINIHDTESLSIGMHVILKISA